MRERKLVDSFGRHHNYLRVSVTDLCNLRCIYCMGAEGVKWLERKKILRYEEIVKVVETAASFGITKVRLTGGEPLVRKDLHLLIRRLSQISGLEDLSMTTNGLLLSDQAELLRDAGLKRVNISLDSLNPETYYFLTRGGALERALAGIEAALKVGFDPVKINVVLMKGINDHEIPDFFRLAYERPLNIRFIEYMPVGGGDVKQTNRFLPIRTALEIAASYEMTLDDTLIGSGPATTYRIPGGAGTVGFISAISGHFCAGCNRLRLTADGFLKPCLYWPNELEVRPFLHDPEGLSSLFLRAVKIKRKEHRMGKDEESTGNRCMSQMGG